MLSGSSITSQGSRRSRSSLYKWSKKWSQGSNLTDSKLDTRSPTPILSQSRLYTSQSPTGSQKDSQSQQISQSSNQSSNRLSQEISASSASLSQKSSQYNTSLFSDEGDADDWLDDVCSQQVTVESQRRTLCHNSNRSNARGNSFLNKSCF